MELKSLVLDYLLKNKGESVSGEKLAEIFFVTRSAVWKAVKSLRQDGYDIRAITNKGYALCGEADVLSKAGILPYLSQKARTLDIHVVKKVTSTNTVLKELAQNGEKAGYVLIACEQSGGKGRRGRSFYSPEGTGVYLSILLRPKITMEDSLLITTSAAVAVSKAIEKLSGKKAQIKWVNDIFVDGKKVCGILTEAALDFESGGLEYAVVGIGVNCAAPKGGFGELEEIAGSVFDKADGSTRCRMAAEILNEFSAQMENLTSRHYLDEYKKRSFLPGKTVDVVKPSGIKTAKALSIDNNARLVVEYEDKSVEHLSSGEVSVKIKT